jgi:zinc transporter, ZIP family
MSVFDTNRLLQVVAFSALPFAAALIGATIATIRPPTPVMRSHLQHLAAGVVFSVVAVELLPDITHRQHPLNLTLGFSLGVAFMLALEWFTSRGEGESESSAGLLTGLGIDVFLDGLLVAIGFNAGTETGRLLTFALSVELLSSGLALAGTLGKRGWQISSIIAANAGVFFLIVLGGIIGAYFSPYLTGTTLDVVLSFGLAALLFLVTEELLVEAHREPETALSTALFFIGFLGFVLLGMMQQ